MQLVDRIEKRRFVGREFLLFLWFESEIFEGTLATKAHGSFGLWIERQIVLTAGKESTRIKGPQPAASREAKESLLLGKLPESAGFHLVLRNEESSFTLKAEKLAIAGLTLPTVLGAAEEAEAADKATGELLAPRRVAKKKRPTDRAREEAETSDLAHESFYERMHLTRDFEALVEALYRDFLALRLGDAWVEVVASMRAWAAGGEVDADGYRKTRDAALAPGSKRVRRAAARKTEEGARRT